jgi:hypothetical protein
MREPGFGGADPIAVSISKKPNSAAIIAAGRSIQVKKAAKDGLLRDENAKASKVREKDRKEKRDREAKEALEKEKADKEAEEKGKETEVEFNEVELNEELVFPPSAENGGGLKHGREEDEDTPTAKRRRL